MDYGGLHYALKHDRFGHRQVFFEFCPIKPFLDYYYYPFPIDLTPDEITLGAKYKFGLNVKLSVILILRLKCMVLHMSTVVKIRKNGIKS